MNADERRPGGVSIIAVIASVAGIIYLLQGIRILGFVAFGPGQAFTNVSLTGWGTLILGFVWLGIGGALFSLRPWAWIATVVVAGISLLTAFWGNLNGWQLGDLFFAMIIPLVVLFYLNSDPVKAAFGLES